MPPKSRKKIKGQARKAKVAAAKAGTAVNNNAQRQRSSLSWSRYNYNNDGTVTSTLHNPTTLTCLHGERQYTTCPVVVNEFLKEFYGIIHTDATSSLLGGRTNGMQYSEITHIMIGYATTLMSIDSYQPSSPITPGSFDQQDAKTFLRNLDITNGCERSLVKFFVNQIPCKCLDEIYSQIKSTKSKMGMCSNCKQMKERNRQVNRYLISSSSLLFVLVIIVGGVCVYTVGISR